MDAAEAVRLTGHARFAELLDPAHPDYNPAYGPAIEAMRAGRGVLLAAAPPSSSAVIGPPAGLAGLELARWEWWRESVPMYRGACRPCGGGSR